MVVLYDRGFRNLFPGFLGMH